MEGHNELINCFYRNKVTDFKMLKDPEIEEQMVVFETTYKKLEECEEFMKGFLLEKAEVYIYSV